MFKRTLAAALALTAAAATSAPATVVEHGRFADESYGFDYDCGFPVTVTGIASGSFHLREGKGDADSAFFAHDRVTFREVHTNPQTGLSFTRSGHFVGNELTARHVSGSVFEVRSIKAGPVATIADAGGNVLYRDRGVLRTTILFDTLGDDVPGGAFVELVDLRLAGQQAAFDRLCEIATELTR